MILQGIERRLTARIEERLPGAAPGVLVQAYRNGRKACVVSVGETYPYYDWASLTKIVFTVPALMLAFDRGLWNFDTRVRALWPSFPLQGTTIRDLLTHSAGAPWWHHFYKEIDPRGSERDRRDYLRQKIRGMDWKPTGESVYSDVGIVTLGFCLEALFEKPLIEVWQDLKSHLYPNLEGLDFHPQNRCLRPRTSYAPTENCPWRGRIMQGEVHDENAWALGGVSSHAGLFGGIEDLAGYGLFLRSHLLGAPKPLLRTETVRVFTERAVPMGKGDWGLGFMKPGQANASCGERFSQHSFGHTGFTGTSLWYDPSSDLLVVILSNRVALGRDSEGFKLLRPLIHSWVVEELDAC
jgi:serine-type D-Ala-D-Ala carboxypeptidase